VSRVRPGTFFSSILPGCLIFSAALFLTGRPIPERLATATEVIPLVILAAGLLLGWRFNRLRPVLALLVLALAEEALRRHGPASGTAQPAATFVCTMVAFLLPLNYLFISVLNERGFFTVHGVWRTAAVLAQPALLALVIQRRLHQSVRFLDISIPGLPAQSGGVPHLALAFAGLAVLLLAARAVNRPGPLNAGLFWSLLTSCFAVAAEPGPPSALLFSAAGLILVVAVVNTSYSMAFRDELTGLPARRALNETLNQIGGSFTAAMVDIDHFKKFNDRHGHHVGDQVLRMVASRLAAVGGGGKAFRYGGEEFTLLFPGKGVEETAPHLEELRQTVDAATFTVRGRGRPRKPPVRPRPSRGKKKTVRVRISIGAAERREEHHTALDVVKAADGALLRAKRGGRNRLALDRVPSTPRTGGRKP
jgi:GGDEF domain-containing protein